MQHDPVELRILGCLVEKQRTTPDAYPLSLNALRNACSQSTNRDPVVDFDEETVREALGSLVRRRLVRSVSGHSGRTLKYRHLLDEQLKLPPEQLAVLAVLMLRGPQTPGELKQRVGRLHPFADLGSLHAALEGLIEGDLAARLPRRPGQKEERYRHLLESEQEQEEEGEDEDAAEPAARPPPEPAGAVDQLRAEVAELRDRVEELERLLDGPG